MKPKISIVTPCYNMEKYIEGTIQSVISQGYENLEYIIIDGGSTDGTLSIIDKYKDSISVVVSEKDNGMYDAIAKGLSLATGEIMAYINADDTYFPHTLQLVSELFVQFPDLKWIGGRPAYINENRILTDIFPQVGAKRAIDIAKGYYHQSAYGFLMQESMFWRAELYEVAGGVNRKLRYAGDFDLWRRFAEQATFVPVDVPLAAFMRRKESISKSQKEKYMNEIASLFGGNMPYPDFMWRLLAPQKTLTIFRRLLTYRKYAIIRYNVKRGTFEIRTNCSNVSYHTFKSALRYFKG